MRPHEDVPDRDAPATAAPETAVAAEDAEPQPRASSRTLARGWGLPEPEIE